MYGNVTKTWKIQKISKRLVKEINIKKHLSILNTKDYEVNAYPFLSVATQVSVRFIVSFEYLCHFTSLSSNKIMIYQNKAWELHQNI